MRVFQIEGNWGFENLRLASRPEPKPGPRDVIVAMRMASLNARDLIVPVRGYGRRTGELPLIPVSDGMGEVVEIGDAVSRVRVGDRVCPTYFQDWISGPPHPPRLRSGLGGPRDGVMADRICLSEEGVVRLPDTLSDAEAATLPCAALTAWSAVADLARVGPGDHVLVQGTGGVALFALAFARANGAAVTVISSSDARLEQVRAMGAAHTFNYLATPDWARASREITAARGGYDVIVELGGARTLPLSIKAIRPGGTIAMIGVLSGLEMSASLGPIVTRQVRLQGVTVGHRDGFEAMLAAMVQHQLRPVLGETFAFEELPAALEHMRGPDRFGKTLIRFH
ncbi:MAG: zinc-dependent alcohol dehydrogenase family protein [Alkalilacustris sp.]